MNLKIGPLAGPKDTVTITFHDGRQSKFALWAVKRLAFDGVTRDLDLEMINHSEFYLSNVADVVFTEL